MPPPASESIAAPFIHIAPDWLSDSVHTRWSDFASSWDDLPSDDHMADGGHYRQRRYAAFRLAGNELARQPHRAHFQERDFNPLNGGVERWFAPMTDSIAVSSAFTEILRGMARLVAVRDARAANWAVEAHQFRIVADDEHPGLPTPEGIHRDGRDWVLILLVGSTNISGGDTSIEDAHGHPLACHRLAASGEALLLDDRRTRHGTSAIQPAIAGRPARRDTLVVTFSLETQP